MVQILALLAATVLPADPPPAVLDEPPAAIVTPEQDVYAEALLASRRDGIPLFVFVGQKAQSVSGSRTVSVPSLAGFVGPCVVASTRVDGFRTGRVVPISAVIGWLSQPLNVGRCPCGETGAGCHCHPHDGCARGECPTHNPLLYRQSMLVVPALGTVCRT